MREIDDILERYQADRSRLMDILWDVQNRWGYIPADVLPALAQRLNLSEPDIKETYSFYHFFRDTPPPKYPIYLADTVIARLRGYQAVYDALEQATGCRFGQPDASGTFGLETTPCIGLSDQEPALLIGEQVFTGLTPDKVRDLVAQLRAGADPAALANPQGHGKDTLAYVRAMVQSNIRSRGPVFFQNRNAYAQLLEKVVSLPPEVALQTVFDSGLKGRGGAGFTTGLKWRMCAANQEKTRYVVCNADEGEPGTFKDRVLLTESPLDVLIGMVIAGYAIGAQQGIIYLRSEYAYLKAYLQAQIEHMRAQGWLGQAVAGKAGFQFDLRIQLGAGAYVCGDETALIESLEGKRGTPRVKPPYPVNAGYLGKPTSVNNVETFAAVTRIMEEGPRWFRSYGTPDSAGTRLLSVSGDCDAPGIYEIEWGITLKQVLERVGARDPWAVQVSGPSGECVAADRDGQRKIALEDLPCNGSLMIFNRTRNLLGIVRHFTAFFVAESCGICVPCRSGNIDLLKKIDRVIAGTACQQDLDSAMAWGNTVRKTSRCGLGGTSPKPIMTSLARFPEVYQPKLVRQDGPLLPSFDLEESRRGYLEALATFNQRSQTS
jgi:[NiFe] hydrogenase diaphorase moiety large subunit